MTWNISAAAVGEGSPQEPKSALEGPKAIVITPEEKVQLARVFPQLVEVKEGPITLENALGELISIQVPVGGVAKPGEGGQKPKKRRRRKKLTEAMRVELTKKGGCAGGPFSLRLELLVLLVQTAC